MEKKFKKNRRPEMQKRFEIEKGITEHWEKLIPHKSPEPDPIQNEKGGGQTTTKPHKSEEKGIKGGPAGVE